jgi:hypothetical protein
VPRGGARGGLRRAVATQARVLQRRNGPRVHRAGALTRFSLSLSAHRSPARCPLGANCCVGEGGPDRTFATLSAWRTHGTYRDKAEAARAVATAARAAALAAISPDPEAAEDDGGLAEVARALDGRTAPRLVLSDLADMEEVDIVTALAPAGRRT